MSLAAIAVQFSLYLGILTSSGTVFVARSMRLESYHRFVFAFAMLGLTTMVLLFSVHGSRLLGDVSGMVVMEMLGPL